MKKLLPILFLGLILVSCLNKEAEKVADQYHSKVKAKEYDFIVNNLISEEGLKESPKEHWVQHFKNMETIYGDIKEVEKLSFFKTSSNTSTTIVTYRYKYIFNSDKSLYEQILLEDNGRGFKIKGIQTNEDEGKLPKLE